MLEEMEVLPRRITADHIVQMQQRPGLAGPVSVSSGDVLAAPPARKHIAPPA